MAQRGLRPFRLLVLLPTLLTRPAQMCDHSSADPGHFRMWNNIRGVTGQGAELSVCLGGEEWQQTHPVAWIERR